jgi:hypothetical protein
MKKLIGRKCKGFKFESVSVSYNDKMDKHIGEPGEIMQVSSDSVMVQFKKEFYSYPLNKIENHLVPEKTNIPELGEGVLMEVSNYEDFEESYEENVLLMYRNRFVAVDEEGFIYAWKYGRKIQEKVTLTKQEIADKFGYDINQLVIK